jgi:hypothetical protein
MAIVDVCIAFRAYETAKKMGIGKTLGSFGVATEK